MAPEWELFKEHQHCSVKLCRATQIDTIRAAENPKANPSPWHSTWVTSPVQKPDWQGLAHNKARLEQVRMLQTALLKQQCKLWEHITFYFPGSFFTPESHTFFPQELRLPKIYKKVPWLIGWNMKLWLWWRKNWGKTSACVCVFQDFWEGGSTLGRLPLNCYPTQDNIKWTSNKYLVHNRFILILITEVHSSRLVISVKQGDTANFSSAERIIITSHT